MEYFVMNNGVKMPMAGIGVFTFTPDEAEASVESALKGGVRLVDTANAYMNEEAVGKGLKKAIAEGIVSREEVFVSTKIWATLYNNGNAVEDTLSRLGLDYVDLLFIHRPAGDYIAGYKLIEKAFKDGKACSLGISNFHGEKLEKLLEAAEIKPHVTQLEAHPYCTEKAIMDRLAEYGTRLMGWYPLGHGDTGLKNEPIFVKLADKYRKSSAQIILRWHTQMDFITIPGSKDPDHIRDNFNIFDFTLTDEEMAEIAKLDKGARYYHRTDEQLVQFAGWRPEFEKN